MPLFTTYRHMNAVSIPGKMFHGAVSKDVALEICSRPDSGADVEVTDNGRHYTIHAFLWNKLNATFAAYPRLKQDLDGAEKLNGAEVWWVLTGTESHGPMSYNAMFTYGGNPRVQNILVRRRIGDEIVESPFLELMQNTVHKVVALEVT